MNIESHMLGDLFEVARRVRRLGIPNVEVNPAKRMVRFHDHRIRARVELEIVKDDADCYWWYAEIHVSNGFGMGPLTRRRRTLFNPWPREVVRAYQRRIWWELRPPRRKTWR